MGAGCESACPRHWRSLPYARSSVGRSDELAALHGLVADAAAGKSRVSLVSGEAGIGKTRLIAEVELFAAQNGMYVLRGNCFEQDRAFPYAPLIDLLRSFVAERSPETLSQDLGDASSELVKLVPSLATAWTTLSLPHLSIRSTRNNAYSTHWHASLAGLTESQPLLLVVEDLHWSDDTSLEFLLYRRVAFPLAPSSYCAATVRTR